MANKVSNKVVVIGTGAVGVSYAYAALNQGIVDELVLIDINQSRVEAEAYDLRHGVFNGPTSTVVKAGSYADCADADIVTICAGVPQKPGETRLQLIDNNLNVFNKIVGEVVKTGFKGIFLLAANPVDVLSYATYKFSGFPKERVIGSGTVLDTARLCDELSKEFNVAPHSINAFMVGEHGDSILAAWSSATIAGQSIKAHFDALPNGKERMEQIRYDVMRAAYKIIEGKGATYYGIGMGLARITRAILRNERAILPISALVEGEYGEKDVFIGTPAVIGSSGIVRIIEQPLDAEEKQKFADSANVLRGYQEKVHEYLK